jgi:hypothetical protein
MFNLVILFIFHFIISKGDINSPSLEDIYKNLIQNYNVKSNNTINLEYNRYFIYLNQITLLKPVATEEPRYLEKEIHIKNLVFTILSHLNCDIIHSKGGYEINDFLIEVNVNFIKIKVNDNKVIISEFEISKNFISKSYDIMYSKYFKDFQNDINELKSRISIFLQQLIKDRITTILSNF